MPTIPLPTTLHKSCEDCFAEIAADLERACLEIEQQAEPKLYEQGEAVSNGEAAEFVGNCWRRKGGGGGTSRILRGRALEKVGVNRSVVFGKADEKMSAVATAKGLRLGGAPQFWAAGVSAVIHPYSPLLPIMHLNLRRLEMGDRSTAKGWFGGGGDITPTVATTAEAKADAALLHRRLRQACDEFDPSWYKKFAAACDEYFYLPHRGERRGLGGIFYDDLVLADEQSGVAFGQAVGRAFIAAFTEIAERRLNTGWDEADKRRQLIKRGRYVEFNLLYDRGTRFGILTAADPEAVLMSLPPLASW